MWVLFQWVKITKVCWEAGVENGLLNHQIGNLHRDKVPASFPGLSLSVLRNYLQSAIEVRVPWTDYIVLKSNSLVSALSTYCDHSRVKKTDIISSLRDSQPSMFVTIVRSY